MRPNWRPCATLWSTWCAGGGDGASADGTGDQATMVLAVPLVEASAKVRTGFAVDDEAEYSSAAWTGYCRFDGHQRSLCETPRGNAKIPVRRTSQIIGRPPRQRSEGGCGTGQCGAMAPRRRQKPQGFRDSDPSRLRSKLRQRDFRTFRNAENTARAKRRINLALDEGKPQGSEDSDPSRLRGKPAPKGFQDFRNAETTRSRKRRIKPGARGKAAGLRRLRPALQGIQNTSP